jgi:hypothetical protein
MFHNDKKKSLVAMLQYIKVIYTITACHNLSSLKILYDKIIVNKGNK